MSQMSKERKIVQPILEEIVSVFHRMPDWVDKQPKSRDGKCFVFKWRVNPKEDDDRMYEAVEKVGLSPSVVEKGFVPSPPAWWPYAWIKIRLYYEGRGHVIQKDRIEQSKKERENA
jgi:hypothetical protein